MRGKLSSMKKILSLMFALSMLFCLADSSLSLAQYKLQPITEEKKEQLFEQRRAPEDVAEIPEDATVTESGLAYRPILSGSGSVNPGPNDLVTVIYKAWTEHGVLIDQAMNEPRTFQLNRGAPGIAELLQLMVVGDKYRAWIIPELGVYRGKTPKWMRTYEMELQSIVKAPEVPNNLTEPPKDAVKTESGLVYSVLQEGRGTDRPEPKDRATLHYDSWSPEGKLLGSSTRRNVPANVDLDRVIPGFAESVLGMVVGEKRRTWIPPELTEGEEDDTVIYDFELLSFLSPPDDLPEWDCTTPDDATVTESGLAYKVVRPGKGEFGPQIDDTVIVNFSVWKHDGTLMDSSYKRGKPIGMTVSDKMPAAWLESLQGMVAGEMRRLWLPMSLGFKVPADDPIGDQIVDLDLLEIE